LQLSWFSERLIALIDLSAHYGDFKREFSALHEVINWVEEGLFMLIVRVGQPLEEMLVREIVGYCVCFCIP
jgi:hypothetical protein